MVGISHPHSARSGRKLTARIQIDKARSMPRYNYNEEFARSINQQIIETAEAMLEGRLSFLLGARKLCAVRGHAEVFDNDADFMVFVAIDSETDALPLGEVRQYWSPEALAKLEPEIQSAEAWAAEVGRKACESLKARFTLQDSR